MTTQNCAECGTRAEPGQSFCDACGAVLSWTDRAPARAGATTGSATASASSDTPPAPPAAAADAPSLVRVSAELDGICERISASPTMSIEVGEELVRLDALARALQQIACDAGGFTRS